MMNEATEQPAEPTFHLNEILKTHIAQNKDILRSAEDAAGKMDVRFDEWLEYVGKMKEKQKQALRDDYTREYIKASNEYTE